MANFFVKLINYFISGVGAAFSWLISLLPDTPFKAETVPGSVDLGYVTYVIPFPTMISHLALLLAAITIYYVIRVAARWLKVARD